MSKIFTLQLQDLIKGAFVAVFSAVITFLYSLAVMPDFSFDALPYEGIATVAFISFLSYLSKQFVTEKTLTTETVAGIELPTPPTAS